MKWIHLLNHPEITFVNSNAIKFDNNILYKDTNVENESQNENNIDNDGNNNVGSIKFCSQRTKGC